jgi:hypothetical protein
VSYIVTGICYRDLERIQLELDVNCPDGKKFYFADPEELGSYTKNDFIFSV